MVQQLFSYFLLMLLPSFETLRRVFSLFHDITPTVVVSAVRVKEFTWHHEYSEPAGFSQI